jgi:hypothetical protein
MPIRIAGNYKLVANGLTTLTGLSIFHQDGNSVEGSLGNDEETDQFTGTFDDAANYIVIPFQSYGEFIYNATLTGRAVEYPNVDGPFLYGTWAGDRIIFGGNPIHIIHFSHDVGNWSAGWSGEIIQ